MTEEQENSEELNTSQGDSGEQNTSEETESEGISEEGTQTEESEHASPEESDEKGYEKRYTDLQAKMTQQAQELAELKGRLTERERQYTQLPSAKEMEESDIAEFNQIMEQHKNDAPRGITSWMKARERKIFSQQQASLSPIYAQMKLLGWRQKQMMEGVTWNDLTNKEKKMQEVIQKNPVILQYPNALEQAEALAIGAKDIKQVKKEILKQEEQRKAHTVGTSKPKGKSKKTVAQRASEFYGMKFAEPK